MVAYVVYMAIKLKLTHSDYEVSNGVWAREGISVSGRSLSHYMTGVLGIEYKSVGSVVMGGG